MMLSVAVVECIESLRFIDLSLVILEAQSIKKESTTAPGNAAIPRGAKPKLNSGSVQTKSHNAEILSIFAVVLLCHPLLAWHRSFPLVSVQGSKRSL